MNIKHKQTGSALLLVVFLIALTAVMVMGTAHVNTEEIMLVQNQVNAADALTIAEAGLNHAFAEIRANSGWTKGFNNEKFNSGKYTVKVVGSLPNRTITSESINSHKFIARAEADITIGTSSPYIIRVDAMRINE